MVHEDVSKGQPRRTRGRPPNKPADKGLAGNEVLAIEGLSGSDTGPIIKPAPTPFVPVLIDFVDIEDGKNKIRITLTKQKNRMFRMQIYLNGVEVRPSTFNGTAPAMSYWNLFKKNT